MNPFQTKENYWVSLSDVMTGLMVIFMFIAISYIVQIQEKQRQRDDLIEEYQETVIALYDKLKVEFEEDFKEENWNAKIDEDLSIQFLNERVLFREGQARIRTRFREILNDFFPRYIEILLNSRFKEKIAEVRIEGHTNSTGDYMYNVELSQERTANVLNFVLFKGTDTFSKLNDDDQELVRFWFTANGFSYGRTLDKNGGFTIESNQSEDYKLSRRVEFRIITKTEELIKQIIQQKEKEDASI